MLLKIDQIDHCFLNSDFGIRQNFQFVLLRKEEIGRHGLKFFLENFSIKKYPCDLCEILVLVFLLFYVRYLLVILRVN